MLKAVAAIVAGLALNVGSILAYVWLGLIPETPSYTVAIPFRFYPLMLGWAIGGCLIYDGIASIRSRLAVNRARRCDL